MKRRSDEEISAPLYEYDAAVRSQYGCFAGVDEAGRGPLCGPVCVAACILDPENPVYGINDSKKLSEKKREALFDTICSQCAAYGIGSATEKEIDEVNILNATYLAMQRAVAALPVQPDCALVDGNRAPDLPLEVRTIIKGDAQSASIAAASILAKVSRDRYMLQMAEKYPQYAFEKHKGYGTKLHYERLEQYGISPIHRLSFLKKWMNR